MNITLNRSRVCRYRKPHISAVFCFFLNLLSVILLTMAQALNATVFYVILAAACFFSLLGVGFTPFSFFESDGP